MDFFEQARRSALADLAAPAEQGAPGRWLEAERQPRGELDRAQHANRILLEPDVRIADRANHLRFEVGETANVIDHFFAFDIVEQAVDREVAAARVLGLRAE